MVAPGICAARVGVLDCPCSAGANCLKSSGTSKHQFWRWKSARNGQAGDAAPMHTNTELVALWLGALACVAHGCNAHFEADLDLMVELLLWAYPPTAKA